METVVDVDYRVGIFKIYIDTAVKMKSTMMTHTHLEIDTRKALDNIPPKAYMVMIFKIIFRIRAPEDIRRGSNLQIKTEYIRAIDRYFETLEIDGIDNSRYKNMLVNFLDVLNLPTDTKFSEVRSKLISSCESVELGECDYHDALIHTTKRCLDHVSELYDQNTLIT